MPQQAHSRRDVLKLLGITGAVVAASQVVAALTGEASVEAASSIAPLLPYYAAQRKLRAVDGMAEMDEVSRQIAAILSPAPA